MNDDEFFARFRKAPRPEFASALHERINSPMNAAARRISSRRRLFACLAVCAALALVLAFSPAARAAVMDALRRIGGITFSEQQQVEPMAGGITTESQRVKLAEAQARVPFTILIPAWVPEGYVLDENALLPSEELGVPHVALNWLNEAGDYITLSIMQTEMGVFQVGEGSLGEVEVNGKTVALVRGGGYDETGQWIASDRLLELMWHEEGVFYILATGGDHLLSVEDLVRAAESLQPFQP